MLVAQVYVAFNILVAVGGIALIFADGDASELGIAMVVGALFAFGSFVSQFWAVAVQEERSLQREIFGLRPLSLRNLDRLRRRQEELYDQLRG